MAEQRKPRTLEESFDHFMSYSDLSPRAGVPDRFYTRAELKRAYEACWTPLQEAKAKLVAYEAAAAKPDSSVVRAEPNTTSAEPRDIPRVPQGATRDPSS